MRRSLFLLMSTIFIFVLKLQAIDIPQEGGLNVETLENGVKVWLQENTAPSHMVSLRVIWKTDEGVIIDSLDCPYEQDEVSDFFEFTKEEKSSPPTDVGIVAVGDFDKNLMKALIKDRFRDVATWVEKKNQSPVSLNFLGGSRITSLVLSYPTLLQSLKTTEDLKRHWGIYFLQKLVQEEFQDALKEEGGIWVDPSEVHYLPQTACIGKVHSNGQDLVEMLVSFLMAVQDFKKAGFSEDKFREFKAEAQKKLLSMSRSSPGNNDLASYYADQFVSGVKCPPYSFFVQTSMNLISEMTLRDVHLLAIEFLKDDSRCVEMNLVSRGKLTESDVKDVLDEFAADGFVLALEDEGADNRGERVLNYTLAYLQLPLKPEESKIIGEVIETVGRTNWLVLGTKAFSLREKEKKIKHVHPMRFLGEIFSNANLKACMAEVEKTGLKWSGFMGGLKPNMEKEARRNNLLRHIEGFSQAVRADPEKVKAYILKHDWEGLVKYLIRI